jgi:imidazolonepropionase
MDILIKNIRKLLVEQGTPKLKVCGKDMQALTFVDNAFLWIKNGLIFDYGDMQNLPIVDEKQTSLVDASGRMVLPAFCDSHTHIVFAGSREMEFVDKIKGLSYEEIFRRGGGILNSAQRLHNASEEELYISALARLNEMVSLGTGAMEIKSGYGLNLTDELKMLRVIKRLKETTDVTIKSNFLGAHALPLEYKGRQSEYVRLVCEEMIPAVAAQDLADFVDVFCDKGFFTVDNAAQIMEAGAKYGLRPKIHANELDFSGGVQIGVKHKALSVDHLEYLGDAEIECLSGSETMPTVLPGAAFFLNLPLSPIRKMIDAGLPVALASDFNPGSSPSGNMQLIMSLACIKYKMLPAEAFNAVTLNSAYAMALSDRLGSIAKGKIANVLISKPVPSFEFFPYSFGSNLIESVILKGKFQ